MSIQIMTPKDLGRVVRAARKAERMRQDDTSGAVGVSDVFLWKLEKGSPGLRLDKVLQVLHGLGINLSAEVNEKVAAKFEALSQQDASMSEHTSSRQKARHRHPKST